MEQIAKTKAELSFANEIIDNHEIINESKSFLHSHIKEIKLLENYINDNLVQAINLIYNVKGRVIVSGVGKSGHIGNKIAATLASTGTPSFFVHPTEAAHGDLGMITANDILILISNSGKTIELNDIIYYSKKVGINIIAITSNLDSDLGKAADITLLLPKVKETNYLDAPMISTTLTLIIGDCIAHNLIKIKNFSKDKYKLFHPGGKIGKNLLKVKDLMHTGSRIPLIETGSNMTDAILLMTSKSFGCIGIIEDNKLIGIISDGDLRRHINEDIMAKKVEEVMTCNPKTIHKEKMATEALKLMQDYSISCLFVKEGDAIEGIIQIYDCTKVGL